MQKGIGSNEAGLEMGPNVENEYTRGSGLHMTILVLLGDVSVCEIEATAE